MGPSRHRSVEGLLTHQCLSRLTADLRRLIGNLLFACKKEMGIKFRELPPCVRYINCVLYRHCVYPFKHLQSSQNKPVCQYQGFVFLSPQPHQSSL